MANVKKASTSGAKSTAKAKKVEAVQTETNMDAIKDASANIQDTANELLNRKVGPVAVKTIVLCVLVVLVALLVIRGVLNANNPDSKVPDYSLVYSNEDGQLMVVGKNGKKPVKLSNDDDTEVAYAHNTDRYILFTKEDSLYLYDKKDGEDTEKIAKDITSFGFSANDKYIYYINEDSELYSYKKDATKIDSDVDYVISVSDDKIFYSKEGDAYVSSLKKSNKEKIEEDVTDIFVDEKGSKVVYLTKDDELFSYKVNGKKATKIGKDVSKVLDCSEDLTKVVYKDSDDAIHLVKKTKEEKIIDEVDGVFYTNAEDEQIVYEYDDELFYQKGNKKEVKVGDSENVTDAYIYDGNKLYYIVEEDDDENVLYYSKISDKKASKPVEVLDDISSYVITEYEKGLVVFSDVESSIGALNIVKNGKATEVTDDVSIYSTVLSNDKKKLYFLGDYSSKSASGTFMYLKGKKAKDIVNDVYTFMYVKNNLIYLATGYSSKSGKADIQVYNGRKAKKILDGVTDVAPIGKTFSSSSYSSRYEDDYNWEDYLDDYLDY